MEGDIQSLLSGAGELWLSVQNFAATLILPSRFIQVAVAVFCLALAWLASRWVGPRFQAWMRGLEGRPKWQLRWLLTLNRRLTLMFFALFLWIAAAGFAQFYTFPSRRYLLVLLATIVTALFCIRMAAQVVRNPFMRRVVIWGLSIYACLHYLGFQNGQHRQPERPKLYRQPIQRGHGFIQKAQIM